MADPRQPSDRPGAAPALQRTALAIVAAWAFPGAGHWIVGRTARALLFGALVWASFGLGLAHEGRLALRDANQPFLTGLQVVANAGVGPADLLARLAVYGRAAYRMPPSARDPVSVRFRARARSGTSIYGTAYLWTAGLMNLLLLFDVWDIGRGHKD